MKELVDYVFVEKPSSDFYSVKLLQGAYTDVIYTYCAVTLKEDKENDTAVLQFQYKIESTPEHIDDAQLFNDVHFKNYIGDLLSHILEKNEFKIGKKSGSAT
jgi:hypothetical protein